MILKCLGITSTMLFLAAMSLFHCRRLKESCTAYSELRRKLDSVEEEKQDQHKKCMDVFTSTVVICDMLV